MFLKKKQAKPVFSFMKRGRWPPGQVVESHYDDFLVTSASGAKFKWLEWDTGGEVELQAP